MTKYFAATLSMWVRVDATDETTAREAAILDLQQLYTESNSRIGRDFPIEILMVRPAAEGEINNGIGTTKWLRSMRPVRAAGHAQMCPQSQVLHFSREWKLLSSHIGATTRPQHPYGHLVRRLDPVAPHQWIIKPPQRRRTWAWYGHMCAIRVHRMHRSI